MRPGAGLKDRSHVGLLTRAFGRSPPGNSLLRTRCAYFPAQAILPWHSRPWRPAPLRSTRSGIVPANWSVARTHACERSQSGLAGVTFSPGQTVTMLDGDAGIIPPGPEVRVVKLARMLGSAAACVPMLRATSSVMHPADPVEAKIKRAADVAEIERSA